MKAVWMAIAVICLVAAAIALWRQNLSTVFVLATIGVMAWFLRYRSEVKQSLKENELEQTDEGEADSTDEDL